MNQRIKKFAEEVGFDLYSEDKENMFQEFAELIVRDNLGTIALFAVANYDSGSPERLALSELREKLAFNFEIEE